MLGSRRSKLDILARDGAIHLAICNGFHFSHELTANLRAIVTQLDVASRKGSEQRIVWLVVYSG